MDKKELAQIGGGWKKTANSGMKYISCKLNNGMFVNLFVNNGKQEGSNQPDYKLMMSLENATEMDLLDEYTIRKLEEKEQADKDRANSVNNGFEKAGEK